MKSATTVEVSQAESELKAAWLAYQRVEKRGLEFGRGCCELRNKVKAQGSHKGLGFAQLCTKLEIPRRTAYHWIAEFEISIGLRDRDPLREIELEDEDDDYLLNRGRVTWPGRNEKCSPEEQRQVDELLENMKRAATMPDRLDKLAVPAEILTIARQLIELGYRLMTKKCHPDIGDNVQDMVALNASRKFPPASRRMTFPSL
jgi:hypothetical protein